MKYKKLGRTGIDVSVVGLGTWAYGNDYWGRVQDAESIDTIHRAVDRGITLIDTAPAYGAGHAEEIVGRAIKGLREKVVVSTKCGTVRKSDRKFYRDLRPATIRAEIEASLRRLEVESIDIYLLHWPDASTPLEETIGEMARLKKEGKFRHFGVSNFEAPAIEKIGSLIEVACVQPHHSILFREREALLAYCAAHDIGVMTYGTLAGGLLSGKFKEQPRFPEGDDRGIFYSFFRDPLWQKSAAMVEEIRRIAEARGKPLSQLAINWAIRSGPAASVLVGAKQPAQVEENAASADWELTSEELALIDAAYERLFRT